MVSTTCDEDKDEDEYDMKFGDDDGYLVMKVIQSRKLSNDSKSYNSQRSDDL